MTQFQPYRLSDRTMGLKEEELNDFFDDLDNDHDGFVTFADLDSKLSQVYNELDPDSRDQCSQHEDGDCEKGLDPKREGVHIFLRALFSGRKERVGRQEFIDFVRTWNIPSQQQTSCEQEQSEHNAFEGRLSWRRAFRVRWIVNGPKTLFIIFVVLIQVWCGIWQGMEYLGNRKVREAMGWGVILAKFCAGALYPTMFFLILSMSRTFATFMRSYRCISRVVDWDRNQSFHIWMACTTLVLGTIHGIAHLTGDFVTASQPGRQHAVVELLRAVGSHNASGEPKSYLYFLTSLPALTGIASLACFWLMALLSMPSARRRLPYEVFQFAHLLMFPIMILLSIHGITKMLGQFPMLGFWIVIPGCLVIYERCRRIIWGLLFQASAEIRVLDEDTVTLSCFHPRGKDWRYQVGQYILLQVPAISLFQWHPFTVSACSGNILEVHIKASGNWTRKLRTLPSVGQVGIDGPFGAPSQRFYEFDNSIVIGSGVGITPFSAIVADLVHHARRDVDPWAVSRRSSRSNRHLRLPDSTASSTSSIMAGASIPVSSASSTMGTTLAPSSSATSTIAGTLTPASSNESKETLCSRQRTVDFHWIVREECHLGWFSSLLNYAHEMFEYKNTSCLQLNINTYVTGKRKNISTHVFRYLLDAYRTPSVPLSALTGLKMRSRFHRPNLQGILQKFHDDMRKSGLRRKRIGVFFCGNSQIARVLADLCAQLTLQARRDGSNLVYVFVMEVFG